MTNPVKLDELIESIKNQHPEADPLQHLSDAVLAADHLGEVADHLIGHFVDQARRSGASWTEIGRSMGVSKQAVQKRFVPKENDGQPLAELMQTFTRYTDRARQAVVGAQQVALAAGNARIEPEHLLAALISDPENLATRTVVALGGSPDEMRAKLVEGFEPAMETPPTQATISARGKKLFELTAREALRLGHNYIGAEHFLLSLLELGDGGVAEVLADAGITKESAETVINQAVAQVLAERSASGT
ncbi:Clp protease N-terminal domain-containing protein [Amycolatopsis sp. YIM 10]|uniref:Clp protease N-terminal domain-containing protein n=1 Tax=Amycolatopsis sp. YIM 10 TaxID=2653857 RepID=UPI00128FFB4B|nr:Clp protease N-terminal domain-containing protein [Amycolatopsis sp. YIM 10]QFU85599.1 ATP-dependent Clp protease ATP-binding subunit ClpC1 [Amycolatopsis sp. YIM 10]